MKVLGKIVALLVITSLTACAQQQNTSQNKPIVEKIDFAEGSVKCIVGMWNTSDGIKVTFENKSEYFFIDIEVPPSIQRDRTEVQITHQLIDSDSLVYENRLISTVDTSLYVAYWLNTLDIFNIENEYGIFFFTSLKNPVGGLDPEILIMWVYYKEKIYKFEGIVPLHQDWSWEEIYSFVPDKDLNLVSEKAYKEVVNLWEQYVQKYKEYYDSN